MLAVCCHDSSVNRSGGVGPDSTFPYEWGGLPRVNTIRAIILSRLHDD